MKGCRRLALLIGIAILFASQAYAQSNGKLYAYANPLRGLFRFADHTWVTDYPSRPTCPNPVRDYWYSAGDCHPSGSDKPPRPLSSADADLGVAECIAKPNDHTMRPGPATANILYGIDGVCHQIANRILAATAIHGKRPITVAGARAYKISRFVYGVYGNRLQWERLSKKCKVAGAPALKSRNDLALMAKEAHLEAMTPILGKEQTLLRKRIAAIGRSAKLAELRPREVADQVNEQVNATLQRLAKSLGPEDFKRFFGWPAEKRILLVVPAVAAETKYQGK